MPPRRGGYTRGRKKQDRGSSRSTRSTDITSQTLTTVNEEQQTIKTKSNFVVAPLIVETESLTKVKLNIIIKNYLSDVKISDIQTNRPNSFILYPEDVKSFNRIINDLSSTIQSNENQRVVVYIPRSIQRILENNKEAFVKKIDLEISEADIEQALDNQGYKFEKITRLMNKENMPLKTIKITFQDSFNRDLFVKLGLQIDSMHFKVEPATYNNRPCQCYKCFRYGHVAKYCKAENQVCSRCGTLNHKHENCPNNNQQPICCNCKGGHAATSTDCPKYKEYQQKIQKTIDQYSSTTKQIRTIQTCPSWKNTDDFPSLKIMDKTDQISIIETLTEKIMLAVEQATERIFEALNRKFEILTNQLGNKLNIEIEDISIRKEDNNSKINNNLKTTTTITTQHRIPQDRSTEAIQNEDIDLSPIPVNGTKRKYKSSPSNSSDKSTNIENNSQI
ncbi:unnamed protein product [Adineta steineri]|uniref:CCHC-type domain-containing protein n=1 Tax=Adineta steineri TaxID=433720 RepID=A0A815ZE66_9BILA|nr:unnamed protein product [Adineta steineri]CAF1583664.1 unnamed protein product [Adineta steineri]